MKADPFLCWKRSAFMPFPRLGVKFFHNDRFSGRENMSKPDDATKNKTNAMRILDRNGIPCRIHGYDATDGQIDGVSVAHKIGRPEELVYKTLVAMGTGGEYCVFVIPVAKTLDLKRAARAVGVKSVELIPVSEINKVTGYIRGGCSPVGMKKDYRTVVDASCLELESLIVSAGKIGLQMELKPEDLITITRATTDAVAAD